jgi:hypothetical protein
LLPLQFSLKAPSSGPDFVNLLEAKESIPQAYVAYAGTLEQSMGARK